MLWTLAESASSAPISFPWYAWAGFVAFLLVATALDLGLSERGKTLSTKAALLWCGVWIVAALLFNAWIWWRYGAEYGEQFFAGYLLEKSLSVDNLFVFVLVFAFFRTPPDLQRRSLVWGILGAMVLRAVMILLGAALIQQWKSVLVLFGLFLVYSAVTMLTHDDDDDPSEKWWVRLLERHLPLVDGYREDRFVVRDPDEHGGPGRLQFTRLFLVLLVIEASDVVFAVDSVPAIFGVTEVPFIVFTSNMFAILGLRALYFALAGALQTLRYLNYGLSLILAFIGLKMIFAEGPQAVVALCAWAGWAVPAWLPEKGPHLTTLQSLGVIVSVLTVTIALSVLVRPHRDEAESGPGALVTSRSTERSPGSPDSTSQESEASPLSNSPPDTRGGA